jgi:hypothetical protein
MKIVAVAIAILAFGLAVAYWTGALQLFTSHPGPHHTHGIVLGLIGALALVWLRFLSAARAA